MNRLLHIGIYKGRRLSCHGSSRRYPRTIEEERCLDESRWIQCRRDIIDLKTETTPIGTRCREIANYTHVEPKWTAVFPGIRVV